MSRPLPHHLTLPAWRALSPWASATGLPPAAQAELATRWRLVEIAHGALAFYHDKLSTLSPDKVVELQLMVSQSPSMSPPRWLVFIRALRSSGLSTPSDLPVLSARINQYHGAPTPQDHAALQGWWSCANANNLPLPGWTEEQIAAWLAAAGAAISSPTAAALRQQSLASALPSRAPGSPARL